MFSGRIWDMGYGICMFSGRIWDMAYGICMFDGMDIGYSWEMGHGEGEKKDARK